MTSDRTVGVVYCEGASGYTLFAAHRSTYLIDIDGRLVHEWRSRRNVFASYLLESGHLLRDGNDSQLAPQFTAGGAAGHVEVVTWDNEVVWWWSAEPRYLMLSHHDLEPISDGRVLVLCWERMDKARCVSEGRRPELLPDNEVWDNLVIEIGPPFETFSGNVDDLRARETWRWSQFAHLVQDADATKKNYGRVDERWDKYDINYAPAGGKARARNSLPKGLQHPSGLQVFDPDWKLGVTGEKDWLHANAVSYYEERALVMISYCVPSEVVIVSRRTSQCVYRFGNPFVYKMGDPYADRKLYLQHAAHFTSSSPLKFLLFNNGTAPSRMYSTVDEYEIADDFNSTKLVWRHGAKVGHKDSFYAHHSSGVHRCPNGNTLVTLGPQGILFEVTPSNVEVWRYISPVEVRGAGAGPAFVSQGSQRQMGKFSIFCARRYATDYPAFNDKDMTPGRHLEDI